MSENSRMMSFTPTIYLRSQGWNAGFWRKTVPPKFHVGFVVYPGIAQLDAMGPAQLLSVAPGVKIDLIWKSLDPVETDCGFSLLPSLKIESCPQLDMICVPGGGGQAALMTDEVILQFLAEQAACASYVTSVCTGSLLLGAAGLLRHKRATSHWAFRDLLAHFGAVPVAERVVRDGKIFTAGGVTAGIDFGLAILAELGGEALARQAQIHLEYDPHPPFQYQEPAGIAPEIEPYRTAMLAGVPKIG